MTLAWEIKSPFRDRPSKWFPKGYRKTIVSIWHVDPETDHTDDSCGWFMRARHGDKAVLERIVKAFDFDWDRTFKSDSGKVYFTGYFFPENDGSGMPNMGVTAIGLNLFFLAALEFFKDKGNAQRRHAVRFMQRNLFEIMLFLENPTDSLRSEIVRFCGTESNRDERIRSMASCIYGWILRETRPWYRHPRWHIWHWKIQVRFIQSFKRWAFSRCCGCGGRFDWGYSPISNGWYGEGPRWFKAEPDVFHGHCIQTKQLDQNAGSPK